MSDIARMVGCGPDDEADRRLVERAREGDRQAFGSIYQRHVDRVYGYLLFRVRDSATAEDLTQEVFIQALRGLPAFDWRGGLAPWLLRIARNAVIDHWRRRGRRPERPMSLVESGDADDGESRIERMAGEEATDALVEVEAAADRERLTAAAGNLTDLQQQVLGFRFAAGLTIRETAELMGKSEGAIKNLQHNALRMLRRQLDSNEVGT